MLAVASYCFIFEVEFHFSSRNVSQVHGMLALEDALSAQPFKHQLLFSSVSSIVAPTGQPNYAAANAILNAHANTKAQQVATLKFFMPVA